MFLIKTYIKKGGIGKFDSMRPMRQRIMARTFYCAELIIDDVVYFLFYKLGWKGKIFFRYAVRVFIFLINAIRIKSFENEYRKD
jgi:hypothetical protein